MSKPYFETETVKVYHGDCREVLYNLNGYDCAVMDPPYCSGGFTENAKKSAAGMGLRSETVREVGWFMSDQMTTAGVCWLMAHVSGWIGRALPEGGTITTFTDWRMVSHLAPAMESSGLRFQNLLVWEKPSAGLGTGFKATHELAIHLAKGTPVYHALDGSNILKCKRINAATRVHQTQKPVELMAGIIRVVSCEGQTVLDAFAGSGSTLVAAHMMGRKSIGIEIDEKNCEEIAKRFEGMLPFGSAVPKGGGQTGNLFGAEGNEG
jgi:site-specific DNA-methyltransferase (adenine-specific)